MDRIAARLSELEARPPRHALLEGRSSLGWREGLDRARKVRSWFTRVGLGPGDRLVIALRDDAEVVTLFLACLGSGVVPIVVDPDSKRAEIQAMLAKAGARAILLEQDLLLPWGQAPAGMKVIPAARPQGNLLSRWLKKKPAADPDSWPACLESGAVPGPAPAALGGCDWGLILYTSGTTGGPKLVPLTRDNMALQADAMVARMHLGADTRTLNLMPISHVDGILTGVFNTIWSGESGIRLEPFTVPRLLATLDAVYKHRATHVVLAPTLLALMVRFGGEEEVKRALGTQELRMIVSAASTLPDALWEKVERLTGRPVVNMWGMSEVGNVIWAGPEPESRRIGTIGTPTGIEVLIVDPETGRPLQPGESGELVVRGPTVMPGYLGDPTPELVVEGVKWFPTGDLAALEPDGSGIVRMVGRKKDIIITGGNNVAPEEVDAALCSHPAVAEAKTIALPDPVWGERVVACVVTTAPATEQELMAHAAQRLIDFKVPREVHILPALPRGRSGKVQKKELLALVQQRGSQGGRSEPEQVERAIHALAARVFHVAVEELGPASTPETVPGWDSMAHLDLVTELERAFAVALAPREVMAIDSLAAATRVVEEALRSSSSGRPS